MNAVPAIDRIRASHAGLAPRLAGGAEWAVRRERALATLLLRGLPDRRDENWKYLDHLRLAGHGFDPAPRTEVRVAELERRLLPVAGARRIVLVDGRFDTRLSQAGGDDGLQVEGLDDLLRRDPAAASARLRAPGDDADDRFALLADAFTADGALIRVADGAAPALPLHLVHVNTGTAAAAHHARLAIEIGARARLMLLEEFVRLGDVASFGNLAAELSVGPGATVTHVRLHREAAAAARVETWVARLAAGVHYEQHLLALGAGLLRSNLRLSLDGRDADCRLNGLFLCDGEGQTDLYTRVVHEAPATRTVQDYRGIATGRGRGAFNGRIVVQPDARGADASQQSRNLLLSPLAEINTRPQLEIRVDEVQCRHGATTGTLDPDQFFYLLSRGLDQATARALLTFAFCHDVIGRLPLQELRATVEEAVMGALPDRDLIRGLA